MARLSQYVLPGYPQHVIQRGNNRHPIFRDDDDISFFRDCLAVACQRYGCCIHAYVFMTHHLRLLLTPTTELSIGEMMQSVSRQYVQYYNYTHQRTDTLWEGRYRATLVDTGHYLLTCYRYIELNPVRAGLVNVPEHYRWSSYGVNAHGHSDALVQTHSVYETLGPDPTSRQQAYRALFGLHQDADQLSEIREATNKGWALGSDWFKGQVEKQLERRSRPAPSGDDENPSVIKKILA